MTPEQVKEFKEAVSMAHWYLDLWRFAEVIGWDSSHAYTQEKFEQLRTLNEALSQFDAETLTKIINAEHSPSVKVVDHLDGNPHNNSPENLRVTTQPTRNEIPATKSAMAAVREMNNRSQQGAVKLGVLFTVFVLVGCLLAVGYVCGRHSSCDAPASSVTQRNAKPQSGGLK